MKTMMMTAASAITLLSAVAAEAQNSPTYRAIRLEVLEETLARGGTSNLVGQVLSPELSCVAHRSVIVYFDAADDVLMDETIATLETDEGGSFYFAHQPATGGEYRAVVEEVDDCAATESNYTAIKLRADIALKPNKRTIVPGEKVTLTVVVDPYCQLLDDLGVPVADLRIERLTARNGWVPLAREPKKIEGTCNFQLRQKPRRTTVYRAVGEGSFTALPRYEQYFIGNISTPVLVEVR